MANIPIRDIPGAVVASPDPSNLIPMDNGSIMQKTTIANAVNETLPLSSQAEAEAGVDNEKRMSSLRTKQAIDAQAPVIVNTAITALNLGTAAATDASDYATAAQGSLADTAIQPGDAELVPSGGTVGQVLVKNSGTNYDTGWASSASATAVSYAAQTLTEPQQLQARTNIGLSNVENTSDADKPISDATQSALNLKADTTNGTISTPTLTLKQSASPTPTAEGDIQWDTDDNAIVVGDGSGQKIFYPSVWEVIEDVTLSGAASYIKSGLGDYSELKFDGVLSPSAAATINLSLSIDDGVNWQSTNDNFGQVIGVVSSAASPGMQIALTSLPFSWTTLLAGSEFAFDYKLYNFNKPRRARVVAQLSGRTPTPDPFTHLLGAETADTTAGKTARNAIRLLPTSGTLTGNFVLMGRK